MKNLVIPFVLLLAASCTDPYPGPEGNGPCPGGEFGYYGAGPGGYGYYCSRLGDLDVGLELRADGARLSLVGLDVELSPVDGLLVGDLLGEQVELELADDDGLVGRLTGALEGELQLHSILEDQR